MMIPAVHSRGSMDESSSASAALRRQRMPLIKNGGELSELSSIVDVLIMFAARG